MLNITISLEGIALYDGRPCILVMSQSKRSPPSIRQHHCGKQILQLKVNKVPVFPEGMHAQLLFPQASLYRVAAFYDNKSQPSGGTAQCGHSLAISCKLQNAIARCGSILWQS
jgi:hypothetical protein